MTEEKIRNCYLRQPEAARLNLALNGVLLALNEHCAYLVGSVLSKPDYHDVDVVVIMEDAKYTALFGKCTSFEVSPFAKWFNASSSLMLTEMTGMLVDFRVQQMTAANKQYGSMTRDPIGINGRGPDFDPSWFSIGEPE